MMRPFTWAFSIYVFSAVAEECQGPNATGGEVSQGVVMLAHRQVVSKSMSAEKVTSSTKAVTVEIFSDPACTQKADSYGIEKTIFHKVPGSKCFKQEYFQVGGAGSGFKGLKLDGTGNVATYIAQDCSGTPTATFPAELIGLGWLQCPPETCVETRGKYQKWTGTGFDPDSDESPSCGLAVMGTEAHEAQKYEYVGCFNGNSMQRPYGDKPSTIDGVQSCRDACAAGGYEYFGAECPHDNGAEFHCECGKGASALGGTSLPETECGKFNVKSGRHCSGPFEVTGTIGTYMLGAGSIGSVYKTSAAVPQKYEYVGCFSGNSMRRPYGDKPSTIDGVESCRDACAAGGYEYFGAECPHDNGAEFHCECGNGASAMGGKSLPETECGKFNVKSGTHCSGPFEVSGTIGTYMLGAGSIGSVYKTSKAVP